MDDRPSIAEDIKSVLVAKGVASADDIFISNKPIEQSTGKFNILQSGGQPAGGDLLQWRIEYVVPIRYTDVDAAKAYRMESALRSAFSGCPALNNYKALRFMLNPTQDSDKNTKQATTCQWDLTVWVQNDYKP